MSKPHKTDKNAKDSKDSPKDSSGLRWVFIWGSFAWFVLLLVAIYHPGIAARVKFFSDSTLNLFIVLAVIAQVLIYRKQWHVMERQWQDAERAHVSVSSLATREAHMFGEINRIVLTIENAGKLPADEISVAIDLIALLPYEMKPRDEEKMTHILGHWNHEYGRTKLFRGNITFEIPIPLNEKLNLEQLERAFGGRARLIIQITITYKDGFNRQRLDYAFRNEIGHWIPWPVWADDEIEKRIAEERSRYHPK